MLQRHFLATVVGLTFSLFVCRGFSQTKQQIKQNDELILDYRDEK